MMAGFVTNWGRVISPVAVGSALLAATAVQASIPPTYNIMFIGDAREARAIGAAVSAYMIQHDAYFDQPLEMSRSSVAGCMETDTYAACIAEALSAPAHSSVHAPVVVWARVDGDSLIWSCAGRLGEASATLDVSFNPQKALFGSGEEQSAELRKAVACIKDAGRAG